MSQDPDRNTIRAGRRRKTDSSTSANRQRAETPKSRRSQGSSSGGGGRPPYMIPIPSSGKAKPTLLGFLLIMVVACIFIVFQLSGLFEGDQTTESLTMITESGIFDTDETPTTKATEEILVNELLLTSTTAIESQATQTDQDEPSVTNTPELDPTAETGTHKQTWTVMLYQDADDKILEQDIYLDLNEAERTGSSERVTIISQVDRFQAGFQGDGDWSSTRRYLLKKDGNLGSIRSEMIDDLGEINMASGQSLVDFVVWSVKTYPADNYVLILSDHGLGWPGGWSDPSPGGSGDANIPLSAKLGDHLFLNELDRSLGEIRSQTGIEKFELIGLDACLMGQLEVLNALAPHARYAVASQEVEPSLGWAYTGFLDELVANPDMNGRNLGRFIVDSYIQDDQRIVDDAARAEFLRQGSPLAALFNSVTPAQLAKQLEESVTLSAIDLSEISTVNASLDNLALKLQGEDQTLVAQARSYTQSFTNIFGNKVPPSYIDLGNFVRLLKKESQNSEVDRAADEVISSINKSVVAEKHGPKKPGATGIAIYFPNSQLYKNSTTGAESYTAIANRFAENTLWDDFLAYHYTRKPFKATDLEAVVPESVSLSRAPGLGRIESTALQLSSSEVFPGNTVLLSADIQGSNIGNIFLFVGYYDQESNSIYLADLDYLESDPTREVDGVYYPTWSDSGNFKLEFDWEPVVFGLSNGSETIQALFKPQSYGVDFEEAIYTVDGIYTSAQDGSQVKAQIIFSNGVMRQVISYSGDGELGAPHEIVPQTGDTFTVLDTWIDLDQDGLQVEEPGESLVFRDQPFTWLVLDAAAGNYVIGYIIEDLDGNTTQTFSQISVR